MSMELYGGLQRQENHRATGYISSCNPNLQTLRKNRCTANRKCPAIIIDESDSDSDTTVVGDDDCYDDIELRCLGTYSSNDFMTDDDFEQYLCKFAATAPRVHGPTRTIKREIAEYRSNGRVYKPGKSVELFDGTFLRIKEVLKGEDEVFLRGRRFQRQDDMGWILPQRLNELCMIVNMTKEEGLHPEIQSDEININEVKRFRIIKLTNHRYPSMSTKNDLTSRRDLHEEGYLLCRTKRVRIWKSVSSGQRNKISEEAFIFLTEQEADPGYKVDPDILRHQWRGATTKGGDYSGYESITTNTIDLSRTCQRYTFGDGFCGAGGMSRGALQAGLRVLWGFDKCDKAMDSYRLNFDTAIGETCEVDQFLTNRPGDIMVDVMHASPPCQTFSPAKTIAAATDDANEACIFSVRELLQKVKPRIATMEETAGLKERHEEFLFATVHTFVDLGYSVRWGLLNCQDYGVPQRRKRLLVIASGYVFIVL